MPKWEEETRSLPQIRIAATEGRFVHPESLEDSPSALFIQTHGRSLGLSGNPPLSTAENCRDRPWAPPSGRCGCLRWRANSTRPSRSTSSELTASKTARPIGGPANHAPRGPSHAQGHGRPNPVGARESLRGAIAGGQRHREAGSAAIVPRVGRRGYGRCMVLRATAVARPIAGLPGNGPAGRSAHDPSGRSRRNRLLGQSPRRHAA